MINAEERFTLEEFEERCRMLGIVQIDISGRALFSEQRKPTASLTVDVGTKTEFGMEYCYVHTHGATLAAAFEGLSGAIKEARRESLGEEDDLRP